jgi:hypothetical protein
LGDFDRCFSGSPLIKGSQRGLLPRGDAKGDSAGGKRVRERLGVSPMSDWRGLGGIELYAAS